MGSLADFFTGYIKFDALGFSLDSSKISMLENVLREFARPTAEAFEAMERLENGAIANATEGRQVGHYWLRAPEFAPNEAIADAIKSTLRQITAFARDVHHGKITAGGKKFTHLLCIGIGGSALGPQLIADALMPENPPLKILFLDNTDPDGFARCFKLLVPYLETTLVTITSKSGSTPEPNNALNATAEFFFRSKIHFPSHAIAITCDESKLCQRARAEKWLAVFPMWDWVGGRTSITSAVGLLPAALYGIDIESFLNGAAMMDKLTRTREKNPAMRLAQCWHVATEGKGTKDMVIIPYRDGLGLLAKYLQQLIMESLGKRLDRRGNVVHQGITVYGNKGSTDQHAYVQQLRDGRDNFFVTFIEILRNQRANKQNVTNASEAADYLEGFLLGTREALNECGRKSITITIRELTPFSMGMLIALYERAVGFYAELIDVNAYDQPGVESGKKAAAEILALKKEICDYLSQNSISPEHADAEVIAEAIHREGRIELVFKLLEFLRANS
ncbi:MAG: glucose-6-phosphate isomerase [Puniceicoccales bacterium]|jgi:glucose-6-phosphate isomerase|nr:glucose-6-phosphate isomerase [Puniceicoccales bacterium]